RLTLAERELAHHARDLAGDVDHLVGLDPAQRAELVAHGAALHRGDFDRHRRHLEAAAAAAFRAGAAARTGGEGPPQDDAERRDRRRSRGARSHEGCSIAGPPGEEEIVATAASEAPTNADREARSAGVRR